MKRVGFIFTNGRKSRLPSVKKGDSPSDFFYGALELQKRGYEIDIIEDGDFPDSGANKFFLSAIQKITDIFNIGIRWDLFFNFRQKSVLKNLNDADVLVVCTNHQGLTLAVLKILGALKPPVIFFSMCPMFPDDNPLKKFIYRKILKYLVVCVENKHEKIFLEKEVPEIKDRLFYIPFGVEPDFWFPATLPAGAEQKYILSMGNDSMRDYATLLESWKPEYPPLKIITRLPILVPIPSNAEVIRGDWKQQYLSDIQIREYIQNSLFVVIPTKESLRSSGPSVCMQSMACGKAVIISKTQGLWDEEVMRDGFNCLLPEPRSVISLREKIEMLLGDGNLRAVIGGNGRKTFEKHFTVRNLTDRLEKVINSALSQVNQGI